MRRSISIALLRTDIVTHQLSTGIRYVRLLPKQSHGSTLKVKAPRLPVQAIPGNYMLFVVNDDGVPSLARHVSVHAEDDAEDDAEQDDEENDSPSPTRPDPNASSRSSEGLVDFGMKSRN